MACVVCCRIIGGISILCGAGEGSDLQRLARIRAELEDRIFRGIHWRNHIGGLEKVVLVNCPTRVNKGARVVCRVCHQIVWVAVLGHVCRIRARIQVEEGGDGCGEGVEAGPVIGGGGAECAQCIDAYWRNVSQNDIRVIVATHADII